MATKRCERCGGDGFVDNPDTDGVNDTRQYINCSVCGGSGQTDLPPCYKCEGNGHGEWDSSGVGQYRGTCSVCNGRGY